MSTKSAAVKLRIPPNSTIWSSHPDRLEILGELPEGVHAVDSAADANTGLVFADDRDSARETVAGNAADLSALEILWVAYSKGKRSDLSRDTLWPILAEHRMRPIGQVALDEVWSAMRFRPLKAGEVFRGGRKP